MSRNAVARGPAGVGERALAPDLARGFMLLFIALANTVWYLWTVPMGELGAHPAPESTLDSVTQFFTIMVVDGRSYPMFAFLFGYGMVQLAMRQEAAGASVKDVNALLRRRNLWLLVFGFFHALLLWFGDVLGAYGLAGLLLGWLFLRRKDTTLLVWASVFIGLLAALTAFSLVGMVLAPDGPSSGTGMDAMAASAAETSILGAALGRVIVWPVVTIAQGLVALVVPTMILLAFWAARRRVLEEPGAHLPLLRWTAGLGIAIGWLGGLPNALAQVGVLEPNPTQASMLAIPHMLAGLFGGLGYVALIALIAHAIQRRGREPGVVLTAITATGKRSLSSYLAQSVLCAPILTAWGLGLAAYLTSWTMFLYAIGVWLITVVAAYLMERAGMRGPAEVLLRRLAYRRSTRTPVPVGAVPPEGEDQERATP
ncbi:DUF418 domain-containing protein [Nocardiopsis lambiniae]|uniref:DUF418 domain-containing protein n=1 Tax=Nocardiopsis lambiniae TaxID=3075539 RepID=A0ABU2M861_9ACTN|nr:DUF418 domain-containing protein [Nocardiopsis sp. DSM 44743]MDT0328822.1 DUF418 domain-containing protein [Nocardiopsis sp. DSM 44743]